MSVEDLDREYGRELARWAKREHAAVWWAIGFAAGTLVQILMSVVSK